MPVPVLTESSISIPVPRSRRSSSSVSTSTQKTSSDGGGAGMSEDGRVRRKRRSRIPVRQPTGLYVHSSPPTIIPVHPSVVRQWLRGGEIVRLQEIVLKGQGASLVGEYSPDSKARAFINNLPRILKKIEDVHEAARHGNVERVENLLKSEPQVSLELSRDSSSGTGLLHKAVIHGHVPLQEWLLDNYPKTVHVLDKEKRNPLHYASGNEDVWRRLVAYGADTTTLDVEGNSPAVYMNHPRRLRPPAPETRSKATLSNQGLVVKPSNIRIWIHDKDLGRLQKVLWEGLGDKLKTETSSQPLVRRFLNAVPYIMGSIRDVHTAAINNDVELLQSKSSDPVPSDILLSKDSNGLNPLHKAAGLGHLEVARAILERAPSSVNARDHLDRTPLHYAAAVKDQNQMYQLLVDHDATDHLEDKKGNTPSHYRSKPSDLEGAKLLNLTPEAPRTAHIFPPSWDWRLLSSEKSSTDSPMASPSVENLPRIPVASKVPKESKIVEKRAVVDKPPEIEPSPEGDGLLDDGALPGPETNAKLDDLGGMSDDEGVGSEANRSVENTSTPLSDTANEEVEINGARLGETITLTTPLYSKSSSAQNAGRNGEGDVVNSEEISGDGGVDSGHDDDEEQDQGEDPSDGHHGHHNDVSGENDDGKVDGSSQHDENQLDDRDYENDASRRTGDPLGDEENQAGNPTSAEDVETSQPGTENEENGIDETENKDGLDDQDENAQNVNSLEADAEKDEKPGDRNGADENQNGDTNLSDTFTKYIPLNGENVDDTNSRPATGENRGGEENPAVEERNEAIADDGIPESNCNETEENQNSSENTESNSRPTSQNIRSNSSLDKGETIMDNSTENTASEDADRNEIDRDEEPNPASADVRVESETDKTPAEAPPAEAAEGNDEENESNEESNSHDENRPITTRSAGGSRAEILAITPAIPEPEDAQEAMEDGSYGDGDRKAEADGDDDEDRALAEELVAACDMESMAEMVLNGKGSALLNMTSTNSDVQLFINNIPQYIAKIEQVHTAARGGDLRGVQTALDRRKFAVARDNSTPLKPTPLHVAALFGRTSVLRYLAGRFPETMHAQDSGGRTPLHYAATLPDNGHFYSLLVTLGADKSVIDNEGRTAEYYLRNKGGLTREELLNEYQNRPNPIDTSGLNFNRFSDKVENDLVSSRKDVDDPVLLNKLDACARLVRLRAPGSLLSRLLRKEILDEMKLRCTRLDNNLLDIVTPGIRDLALGKSRMANDPFFSGLTAPDYESYSVFEEIFHPAIRELNNIQDDSDTPVQPASDFFGSENEEYFATMNIDPSGLILKRFTVEISRNLKVAALPKNLKLSELEKVEVALTAVLTVFYKKHKDSTFEDESGENHGSYYSLSEVLDNKEVFDDLKEEGLLADGIDDPVTDSWPYGRGVFVSPYGDVVAWINIRDHMKIFAVPPSAKSGAAGLAYKMAADVAQLLAERMEVKFDPKFGHLTSDPAMVGSGVRFKSMLNIPYLSKDRHALSELCKERGLHVKPAHRQSHYHVYSTVCLGITEIESFKKYVESVKFIVDNERLLMKGTILMIPTMIRTFLQKTKN
ncbi:ATP:guanido phosphotransferase, C-terminal catalytic domain [Nesidiocoris tenuis]|uniref:ATP:guanido phosphotransferase, C-terminal catalytic domain n=1 Tax=Nesidiocoris tenuis TaxID=355587 RepID=A0ABN7AWA5_9HEMI|nr:ATP:guanido phosphotransferase, C-terminal catalytic domain [Nesidiocoris tenuis]